MGGAAGAGPAGWKNSSLDFFFSLSDTGFQRETVEMHNLQSKLLLIYAPLCPFAVALRFFCCLFFCGVFFFFCSSVCVRERGGEREILSTHWGGQMADEGDTAFLEGHRVREGWG